MGSLRKFFSKSLVGVLALALTTANLVVVSSPALADDTNGEELTKSLNFQLSYPEDTFEVKAEVIAQGFEDGDSISLISEGEEVESKPYAEGLSFSIKPPVSETTSYKFTSGSIESPIFQVAPGAAGYSIAASLDREFVASDEDPPVLTWVSNTDLSTLGGYYSARVYDKTNGNVIYAAQGATGTFTLPKFYEDERAFGVVIAKNGYASNYSNLSEIQAEIEIVAKNKPWIITNVLSKDSFAIGTETPILNSQANQPLVNSLKYYLVKANSGDVVGANTTGEFQMPTFEIEEYVDYKIYIAKEFYFWNISGASEIAAISDTIRVSRIPFSLEVEISSEEYASEDENPVLNVTANQMVGGSWAFYWVDETTGKIVNPWPYAGNLPDRKTSGFILPKYPDDEIRFYSVYVARAADGLKDVSQLQDIQAVSESVNTGHKDWHLDVSISQSVYESPVPSIFITAKANQQMSLWGDSAPYLVNVETGEVQPVHNLFPDLREGRWGAPVYFDSETSIYRVYMADATWDRNTENHEGVHYISDSVQLSHKPWSAEYSISGNPDAAVHSEWPVITMKTNQDVSFQNRWYYVLTDASTGDILYNTWGQWGVTDKTITPPRFWDTANRHYRIYLVENGVIVENENIKNVKKIHWESDVFAYTRANWSVKAYLDPVSGKIHGEANHFVFSPLSFYGVDSAGIVRQVVNYPDWGMQKIAQFSNEPENPVTKIYLALEGTPVGSQASELKDVQAVSNEMLGSNGTGNPPWIVLPGIVQSGKSKYEILGSTSDMVECIVTCTGDPINTYSGEFYEENSDLSTNGAFPIDFQRTFSTWQRNQDDSNLGKGWQHNFNRKIAAKDANYSGELKDSPELQITANNGSKIEFFKNGNSYYSYREVKAKLDYDQTQEEFVLFTEKDRATYYFDKEGKYLKTKDRNGNEIALTYDASGNLEKLSNGTEQILFTYNSNGNIASIANENYIVEYNYNSNGNLVEVQMPEQLKQQYVYDSSNRVTSMVNISGGTTSNVYDTENRVIQQTDPKGRNLEISYQGNDRIITSHSGVKKLEKYSEKGALVSVTENYGENNSRKRSYTFTPDGQVASITHENGAIEFNYYNSNNYLTKKVDELGNTTNIRVNSYGDPLSITYPNGSVSSFEYDQSGNRTKLIDPLGKETAFTYNSKGLLSESSDSLSNKTTLTYDAKDRLISETKPDGTVISYGYSSNGEILSVSDSSGRNSSRTVNILGKSLTETDPMGNVTEYDYDDFSRMTKKTFADGTTEKYFYDATDNLVKAIDQLSNEVLYEYDLEDRLIKKTDKNGGISEFKYDGFGNLVQSINELGHATKLEYDKRGYLISIKSPEGLEKKYTYNRKGELVKSFDSSGEQFEYQRDFLGNVISVKDKNDFVTTFEYDTMGRLLKQIYPNGDFESYEYDDLGRNVKFIDALGNDAVYAYDAVGNLVSSSESGITKSYDYDEVGNLTSVTDQNVNSTKSYSYDHGSNLISESINGTVSRNFAYDEMNRRIGITQNNEENTFSYDDLGNLTSKTSENEKLDYSYDSMGNLTKLNYHSGLEVNYEYDLASQLKKVKRGNEELMNYSYNHDGKITKEVSPVDETVYQYDQQGRIVAKNGSKVKQNYTYDPMGNSLSSIVEFTTSSGVKKVESAYTFDNRYRLNSETKTLKNSNGGQEELVDGNYTFDKNNKMLTGPSSQEFSFSNLNQTLTKKTQGSKEIDFTYSPAGNVASKVVLDSTIKEKEENYSFDSFNRLTGLSQEIGSDVTENSYAYAPEGVLNNVSSTKNSITENIEYLWDTSLDVPRLLSEISSNGRTDYIYGMDNGPIVQIEENQESYLQTDVQGNIIGALNAQGSLKFATEYSAYGEGTDLFGNSADTVLGYKGALKDRISGNYYMINRFYDPETGNFLSVDPYLNSTHSPYSYVTGNPLNQKDPLGLAPWTSFDTYFEDTLVGSLSAMDYILLNIPSGAINLFMNNAIDICSDVWQLGQESGETLLFMAKLIPGVKAIQVVARAHTTVDKIKDAGEAIQIVNEVKDLLTDKEKVPYTPRYSKYEFAGNRFHPKASCACAEQPDEEHLVTQKIRKAKDDYVSSGGKIWDKAFDYWKEK